MDVRARLQGSILEEKYSPDRRLDRRIVAAGSVFTLPAFVMGEVLGTFDSSDGFWKKSTALIAVGHRARVLFFVR